MPDLFIYSPISVCIYLDLIVFLSLSSSLSVHLSFYLSIYL